MGRRWPSLTLRLHCFDEHPARRRLERTIAPDDLVKLEEPLSVLRDVEVGHDPGHDPKEVHDRADVEEGGPWTFDLERVNTEAGRLCGASLDGRISLRC